MITAEAGTGVAARTAAEVGTAGAAGEAQAGMGVAVGTAGTAGEAQAGTAVAAGTKPPVGAAEAGTTTVGISAGTSTGGMARDGEEPLPLRNSGMAGVGPGSAVGA
jgi:hypothetical protein